jgi:cytoplasmic iron level regulating protein YaaA (DUF328/UPF0246 family)
VSVPYALLRYRQHVLILLPPSEGKTAPETGERLASAALSFPSLKKSRTAVLKALVALCTTNRAQAGAILGLGATQQGEIALNARLVKSPTAAAIEIYTGVLFDALSAHTLTVPERRHLDHSVAIASALFGLLGPSDHIPAYRLSGDTTLPPLGTLASVWRTAVSAELATQDRGIFDLRSGAYASLGPVPACIAEHSVTGRVLLERNGKRSIVSHHNKATKGRIVRSLVQAPSMPSSVDDLLDALTSLGYAIELHEATRIGAVPVLDIIVREI